MLFEVTQGYIGWAWPLGLYAAWLNPGAAGGFSWDYTFPNFVLQICFCLATLMLYDAYSYFVHRWMHLNKTAFVWLHVKHHEHHAALDVRTAGYMTVLEGVLSDALPMLAIYVLGAATGNWWYSFAGGLRGCGKSVTHCSTCNEWDRCKR
jgi:sterol desaturase/sphingolipid hydroxylase (fatty acid hydroxylase superfamily)